MLNEITEVHLNHIKLWYLVQHSLSSFQKLIQHFGSAASAIEPSHISKWATLNLHKNHLERATEFQTESGQQKFQHCLDKILTHSDFIVIDTDLYYPKQLLPYSDRPPILFGKGSMQNLSQPQVAIVGSRKPSPHGKQVAYDFAYYLSEKGFFICSGLAQGIDEAAHLGAIKHHRTIAVIGTGLDQVYPSQNQPLQAQILEHSGTVISEFLPETKPLQHHFPRRNRIVSGLSLGVLVAEAKLESGSLITAQAAANQGKTTFAIPGHIYSEYHQGCHQLIREGAILVDHPEQIIEDLALPTQWQHNQNQQSTNDDLTAIQPSYQQQKQSASNHAQAELLSQSLDVQPDIPEHLFKLYQHLDWIGQDLDQIAFQTQQDAAQLSSALMELELMGLAIQQNGLYLRCRPSH